MKRVSYDPIGAMLADVWQGLGGFDVVFAAGVGLAAAWFVWRHWPDVGP